MYISKNNLVYMGVITAIIIALTIYIFGRQDMVVIMLIVQFAFVLIGFSLIGEWFVRLQVGAVKIRTREDNERLTPLFNAVYSSAKKKYPGLSANVKLYIIEQMEVNAFAYGVNTVIVTRGLMLNCDDEMIKGALAHEFGHLTYGDTLPRCFLRAGNIYSWLILGLANVFLIMARAIYIITGHLYLAKIIEFIFTSIQNIYLLLLDFLMNFNARRNEYKADHYAYEIGYGKEILHFFYYLHRNYRGNLSFFQRIMHTHPETTSRIEALETLGVKA